MMMKRSSVIHTLPKNLLAGFVVSLIALPLGLSLALASGMPASAGLIAAIVGGIVASLFGGSYVTIAGPGYSLVVVLLSGIALFGEGDQALGYPVVLSAIVVAGLLTAMLGFLKMGRLSEFFPASAIQGMLASIGVSLLVKQFPIMFGLEPQKGSVLAKLFKMPSVILEFLTASSTSESIQLAGLVGLGSLLVLGLNSSIRNRYYQQIPATMWIVLLSIGLSYFYEWRGMPHPISRELFIELPNSLSSMIHLPNFEAFKRPEFWSLALTIALIGSLESLLSIKAVDNLDPQRRRSNANKDLKALGLATALSGLLGGLNVVTVISRSSVNVTQNATNRSSNFFHGVFLLLFLLFFKEALNRIPLSALAAILVYTGFKLAHPLKFVASAKVGKEQLFIFISTLLAALSTNLIAGVLLGTLFTLISHMVITRKPLMFILHVLKPNVLAYLERDTDIYYVSVKHFCSFLNFYKLKSKLDAIGATKSVVIDFSLCEFVDHTAMEGVESYVHSFQSKGGSVSIIGLDTHGARSTHPFAVRSTTSLALNSLENLFTRRQKNLEQMAQEYHWEYSGEERLPPAELQNFEYFKTKELLSCQNHLNDKSLEFRVFDLSYSEGEFITRESQRNTVMLIQLDREIASFVLDREGFADRLSAFAGFRDIDIEGHKSFNRTFHLSGPSAEKIQSLFSDSLILLLESNPVYLVESTGKHLLVLRKDRLLSPNEIKTLVYFGRELKTHVL